MSIQAYNTPSFWYNLSSNNEGSLCQLLLLEECIFHSILVKCGLIRRKVVFGEMATIIRNDAWTSFKSEYELDIEINKSKVDILVQNKVVRRNVYFLRIGKKIILHLSKHPNSTSLVNILNWLIHVISIVYFLQPLWTIFLILYLGMIAF